MLTVLETEGDLAFLPELTAVTPISIATESTSGIIFFILKETVPKRSGKEVVILSGCMLELRVESLDFFILQ